jgi:dephospho-CoA kinase
MIIGIVGSTGSGKGEISNELEKRGFVKLIFSDFLREECKKKGIAITRDVLRDLGNELREKNGAGYIAKRLLEKVDRNKNYVLEGIRNPDEIKALREFGDSIIVGLEAPIEKRLQWIIMRNRENDPHSIQDVKKLDDENNGKGQPEYGLQIDKCMKMIDIKLVNDKSKEDLKKKVDKLLRGIK